MENAILLNDAPMLVNLMKSAVSKEPLNEVIRLEMLLKVLQKSVTIVTKSIADEKISAFNNERASKDVHLTIEDLQLFEPRGRFNISMDSNGISIHGKGISSKIYWGGISYVISLPNPQSSKKDPTSQLALSLSEDILYNSKPIRNLLMILSSSRQMTITEPFVLAGDQLHCFTTLLEHGWGKKIANCQPTIFQSANGQLSLRCFRGVQEGSLYLLADGVLFLKPMLWIHADNISSITAGRGGSAQTRYIDIIITSTVDKTYEFGNIDRDELPFIQHYVGCIEKRRAMQAKTAAAAANKSKAEVKPELGLLTEEQRMEAVVEDEEEDEDSEDDDDSFDPDGVGSDESDNSNDSDDSDDSEEDNEDNAQEGDEEPAEGGDSEECERHDPTADIAEDVEVRQEDDPEEDLEFFRGNIVEGKRKRIRAVNESEECFEKRSKQEASLAV